MAIIRAPEGKIFRVSSIDSSLKFGTIIDSSGVEYTPSGILSYKDTGSDNALFRITSGEGISSLLFKINDKESSVVDPYDEVIICPIGSKYSWSASVKEGYNVYYPLSGQGVVSNESSFIDLRTYPKEVVISITLGRGVSSFKYKINGKEVSSYSSSEIRAFYGDTITIIPETISGYFSNGYIINATKDSSVILEAIKIIPEKLEVLGDWSAVQRVISSINPAGLVFKVNYIDGSTKEVPVYSVQYPKTWGTNIGEQTCIFSYVENGIRVSGEKSALVEPLEIRDKEGTIWIYNANFEVCGIKSRLSDSVTLPLDLDRIAPYGLSNLRGVKKITLPSSYNYISEGAFSNCRDLEEVVFTTTEPLNIGKKAFSGCISLTTIDALSCGDNFCKSIIGDEDRDVWEDCKLKYIKISQGNFNKSLGTYLLEKPSSVSTSYFRALGIKYNISGYGFAKNIDGFISGNPLIWEVYSEDIEGNLNKALELRKLLQTKSYSFDGKLMSYEFGNYLRESNFYTKTDRWDFRDTFIFFSKLIPENNKITIEVDLLGLGSEDFDYNKVIDSGYYFKAFNDIGIISKYRKKTKIFLNDIVYPGRTIRIGQSSYNCLDLFKPVFK